MKFNIRDLVFKDFLSISFMKDIEFTEITFDDGSVHTLKGKQVYASWFLWEMFRIYPETPVLFKHTVTFHISKKPFNSDTLAAVATDIVRSIWKKYKFSHPDQFDVLRKTIYSSINICCDNIKDDAMSEMSSIDILDLIEVDDHPKVKQLKRHLKDTPESIGEFYKKLKKLLSTDPDFITANNGLIMAMQAGIVKVDQVMQMVGTRGYVTEVDGSVIPNPVRSSFTDGLNSLFEFLAESRNAAKAYMNNDIPIEKSEYFNRRLQILTMIVESIWYGDCGTDKTMHLYVTPEIPASDETPKIPAMLPNLDGCHYLDENNQLQTIDSDNDTHLVGTYIRLRSVIGCKLVNKHKICSTCFGATSFNISRYSNIGHLTAALLAGIMTQKILSTKHYTASAGGGKVVVNKALLKYVNIQTNPISLRFHKNAIQDRNEFPPSFVFLTSELFGIGDVMESDDISNTPLTRVSSVSKINVIYNLKHEQSNETLDVRANGKRVHLTTEFIEHIKTKGISVNSQNNYVVSLEGWDFRHPIFFVPDVEFNALDLSTTIATMIESSKAMLKERHDHNSYATTLISLNDVVNSELSVHFSILQTILYSLTIPDPDSKDLGRNAETPILGVASDLIKNRSMGAALAYENILDNLYSAESFYKFNVPDAPHDVFVTPREVVAHYSVHDDIFPNYNIRI